MHAFISKLSVDKNMYNGEVIYTYIYVYNLIILYYVMRIWSTSLNS